MITLENIDKKFGKNLVLNNINLNFEENKVTAVLGPNGSGKTTLIKIILGLVKPALGKVYVDDFDISNGFLYRGKLGYMPQIAKYPENLTANELLSMISDVRENKNINPNNIINAFKLNAEMEKPFKSLSGGTKQKISALIAFVFNPSILILDEPTAGLDPVSSSYFKDLINKEKQNKKTVILTSHILNDVQELADDIVFILEGKIKYKGSVESLLKDQNEKKLERAIADLMKQE
ncbi:MAG: ABC transporter ATP-binding protein [Nitrososphaeraceae archaeon]|nr:ABC transporter ATP-binding protein [Nitrososphaeraceae archaeon]